MRLLDDVCRQCHGPGHNTSHHPLPGREGGENLPVRQPVDVLHGIEDLVGDVGYQGHQANYGVLILRGTENTLKLVYWSNIVC